MGIGEHIREVDREAGERPPQIETPTIVSDHGNGNQAAHSERREIVQNGAERAGGVAHLRDLISF